MNRFNPFIFIIFSIGLNAQNSLFIAPDTICQGEQLPIEYIGPDGSEFCWIASPLFDQSPSIKFITDFPQNTKPLFSDVVKNQDSYFMFVSIANENGSDGSLLRLDFGNSLENNPTSSIILSNLIPWGQEGLQIVQDENNWWGFIIGHENLVRINFGSDLTNIPSVENLGNIGNLKFPHDLFISKENEIWFGLFIDKEDGSISRFNFGNNLSNIPIAEIINTDLESPSGIFPIIVDNKHYLFVTDEKENSIERMDFGDSYFNTPIPFHLGNVEGLINQPRDISIFHACDFFCGFVLNRKDSTIVKLDFSNNIENQPTAISLDYLGKFEFPHSITEGYISENGLNFLITSIESNDLTSLNFPFSSTTPSICTNSSEIPPFSFSSDGNQFLILNMDEGLPTQNSGCKEIHVLPSPDLNLPNDTSLCLGDILVLESNFPQTIWQNGETGLTYEVTESNTYSAQVTENECITTDSIEVIFENCEDCLIAPNIFTPDFDNINDIFKPLIKCSGEINNYSLQIYNRWGQKVFESNNPETGWDGRHNGQLAPTDVFVWKVFLSIKKNEKLIEKNEYGDLTLVR